jgi:hypothetical protein
MPRKADSDLLHAALVGLGHALGEIESKIADIRTRLGQRGVRSAGKKGAKATSVRKRKPLSAAARQRIAAAQRKRWRKWKKVQAR